MRATDGRALERGDVREDRLSHEAPPSPSPSPSRAEEGTHPLGADRRVRARDVDELLRQLVEEDGTAYVVVGAPGVYAFAPPRPRRLAA